MSRNISPRARPNPLRWDTHIQTETDRQVKLGDTWFLHAEIERIIIIIFWSFVADGRWRREHTRGVLYRIDPRALERISVSISASGRVRVSVVTQSRANPVLGLTADEAEL